MGWITTKLLISEPSSMSSIDANGGMAEWRKVDENRKAAVTKENICQVEKYFTQNEIASLKKTLMIFSCAM